MTMDEAMAEARRAAGADGIVLRALTRLRA